MEEAKLIEEAKSGDKFALERLLSSNYSILKGYVIKMTYDKELSKDIVQETMLRAVVNINKFQQQGKFSTYLIKIATNLYRDHLRKNRKTGYLEEDLPSSFSLESSVISKLKYEELVKILMSLPYEKRSAFILRFYYDYSYEDISKILDLKLGTVKSRIHYAVSYIKEKLKEG